MGFSTIKFIVNNVDMTDSISESDFSYTIEDCTSGSCKTVDKIDTSKKSSYRITYKIVYLGTPFTKVREVHVG